MDQIVTLLTGLFGTLSADGDATPPVTETPAE